MRKNTVFIKIKLFTTPLDVTSNNFQTVICLFIFDKKKPYEDRFGFYCTEVPDEIFVPTTFGNKKLKLFYC